MPELAERLLRTIRKHELFRAGDRVAVAVSGGADSVALLLLLGDLRHELGIVLSVAHVNHKLRGEESDEDERFVVELAAQHGLELFSWAAPVKRGRSSGIESEARRLRYEYFRELAHRGKATKIATAHTLDDQAETLLLRVFRGTGIRGLAGIHPRLQLRMDGKVRGEVVRPLLSFQRTELREFLQARGHGWREDSSNRDETFLRNRIRRRLLPLIAEEFGGAAVEHMAELAEIARAEEELWSKSSELQAAGAELDVNQLRALPLAVQRRLVRAWIEQNGPDASISFGLIESILSLAGEEPNSSIELPLGRGETSEPLEGLREDRLRASKRIPWNVRRGRTDLIIEAGSTRNSADYEYRLTVPGEVSARELGLHVTAQIVDIASVPENERHAILNPARLAKEIVIRNWRAGDRYWPAHTRQEKKVKELLNERHVIGPDKKIWPVAESQGEIVWVRGFAAPEPFQARNGKGIWIREIQHPLY